jgi:hypothetical protein
MKRIRKAIAFILLNLGCVLVLGAAESATRIYLTPGDSIPLLVAEGEHMNELTDVKPMMDSELREQGWMMGTWNGATKGYVFEGSATKQLTLPAGTMVYLEPTLESTVITMVDTNDERNETFRVTGVQQDWEVVEFQKPMRVYWKNEPQVVHHDSETAAVPQAESTQLAESGDAMQMELADANAVALSDESSSVEENAEHADGSTDVESSVYQEVSDVDGAELALVDATQTQSPTATVDELNVVQVAATDDSVFDGPVVEAVEVTDDSVLATDCAQGEEVFVADVSEESKEPAPTEKKMLPPVEKDPLARKTPAVAASANRQLTGKIVKSSLLSSVLEHNNQYELRDKTNKTLAYLDMSGVNDVYRYLDHNVVVNGSVTCKRPSAPLTMKVKLIRIVR